MAMPVPLSGSASGCATIGTRTEYRGVSTSVPKSGAYRVSFGMRDEGDARGEQLRSGGLDLDRTLASGPREGDPVVGTRPFAVHQLGLRHRRPKVDVPEGGRGVLDQLAPEGHPEEAALGDPLRLWSRPSRRYGTSRPRARACARGARRPVRLPRSGVGRARRSSGARSKAAPSAVATAARSPGRRGARDRSGRRSSSGPGARSRGRCRPNPSDRRPPCRASGGNGRACRCGCRRRRARCGASPIPSGAACRSSTPAGGSPSGRTHRCGRCSHRCDHVASRPSSPGLLGDTHRQLASRPEHRSLRPA